jgi:hypothetical protein
MLRRLGFGCLLVLVVQGSTAAAASDEPMTGPEALWQAFPLDPTGVRVETTRSQALRALPEAAEPAPTGGGASRALIAVAAGGLVVVLAAGVVTARRRHPPSRRLRTVPLSQVGWPGPRRMLPVARPKRHPDIPARGRVRILELTSGSASSPPEWRRVEPPD